MVINNTTIHTNIYNTWIINNYNVYIVRRNSKTTSKTIILKVSYNKTKMKRKHDEDEAKKIHNNEKSETKKKKKKKKRKKSSIDNNNDNKDIKQVNNKNDKKIINLETEAADYLESFVNDKDNWKFKKKIQVWLLKNAFDPSAIKKTVFPSFLEYLKGLKGISKDLTLKKAKDILEVESLLKDDDGDNNDKSNQQDSDAFKRQKKRARIRLKRANAIAKVLA